jgi:single-strand DNA-binding protein
LILFKKLLNMDYFRALFAMAVVSQSVVDVFGFTHPCQNINSIHGRPKSISISISNDEHLYLSSSSSLSNPSSSSSAITFNRISTIRNSQNEGGSNGYFSGNFFDDDDMADYNDDEEEDEFPPDLMDEFAEYVPQINSVTLVGRVGQSPEPRYFNDNKVVLRLSLAVKRKYHPLERQVRNIQSGEEETDWFNLEMWGRDAEYAGKYVTKGARIGITGSLNVDTWTDKVTGEERWSNKIVVKHLDILETRAEAELRMRNRPSTYQGNSNYGGGGGSDGSGSSGYDNGDGPSSAGTGGFFDN